MLRLTYLADDQEEVLEQKNGEEIQDTVMLNADLGCGGGEVVSEGIVLLPKDDVIIEEIFVDAEESQAQERNLEGPHDDQDSDFQVSFPKQLHFVTFPKHCFLQ